ARQKQAALQRLPFPWGSRRGELGLTPGAGALRGQHARDCAAAAQPAASGREGVAAPAASGGSCSTAAPHPPVPVPPTHFPM
ncbi:unnamed protein product, partial [Urochloa humidicola]